MLPIRFWCHYYGSLESAFLSAFTREADLGKHYKMLLSSLSAEATKVDTRDVCQLQFENLEELQLLYSESYPGNYFTDFMLMTGKYFGIRQNGVLVSVCGVHVYSLEYQICALGNIATHPKYRGKGFSKKCIVRLIQSLEEKVKVITLNVKSDNTTAIHLYSKIGFEISYEYYEASFARK
jgi:ribosomal protein S18 acetylase RimI-like enzyme